MNDRKRCFLVVGPECAGNRILAAILARAGCAGGGTTTAPLNTGLPTDEDPVVMIRSYPHGGDWPNLRQLGKDLAERDYAITILLTVRDPHAITQSQIERGERSYERARHLINEAYWLIFEHCTWLRRVLPGSVDQVVPVPIESWGLPTKERAATALCEMLGLPDRNLKAELVVDGYGASGHLKDSNAKYYA